MTKEPKWKEAEQSFGEIAANDIMLQATLRKITTQIMEDLCWLAVQTDPSRSILDIVFADKSFSVVIIETAHKHD
jgi:hypothetical protein